MAKNRHNHLISVVCFVVTVIVITLLFPKNQRFQYEYQQGRPWQHEDLVTPFDFPIIKSQKEVNDEVNRIKVNNKLFFKLDTHKVFLTRDVLPVNIEKEITRLATFPAYTSLLHEIVGNESMKKSFVNQMQQKGYIIIDSLYHNGVMQESDNVAGRNEDMLIYVFLDENAYEEKFLGDFYTMPQALGEIKRMNTGMDSISRLILESALVQSIRPNIMYDEVTTSKFRQDEINNIVTTKGVVTAGQVIIAHDEIVNEEKIAMLDSYKAYYNKTRGGLTNNFKLIMGQLLFVGILFLLLYLFLLLFRKSILLSYKKTISILSLEIVAIVMIVLVNKLNIISIYIIPFTILPILVRSFYDTRLALFTHIIATLMAAYFAPNNYEFLVLQMGAGMISIFSFVGFRKRIQLFTTILMIFFTYALVFTALTLMKGGSFTQPVLEMYLYFLGSCVLTLLTFAFIFIFEKIFGLYSDFTLLELTDTNAPLLRELSQKAPGTFQHSVQVANIAEAAINEIGGNSLLIRAGALYHDIGKMDEPRYFIENQVSGINPHSSLTDEESAGKIIHHVLYGVELAKKHGLPSVIIEFIRTHHGNQKVKYFYRHYVECHPDSKVDLSLFTYPGPTPVSKETAVLMMVDSVEAASRSIEDPDYDKLSCLVDKIIDEQIRDKQFDRAEITIRDINRVKQVLKDKLVAIYHVRIEYPEEQP